LYGAGPRKVNEVTGISWYYREHRASAKEIA
jgi:hypothetical protein